MLTRDLLKFRFRNGFRPCFVDPSDPERLRLAAGLLAVYQEGVEAHMTRGEVAELVEALIKVENDSIFAAGLEKLLSDHATYETVREIDYPAERRKLFGAAAAALASGTRELEEYRKRLWDVPGAAEFMAGDIYGDLPDFERLTGVMQLYPAELLNRYNLALVQGLLLYAESVELETADPEPAELRRMFKYLKFFRLLAEVRRRNGEGEGLTLKIDGPFSLFANTRKYALQLAAFFPAVVNLKRWTLSARIRLGGRSGNLKLDQTSGLVSHYRNFSSYVPEEIRMFHRLFRQQSEGWRIVGDSPFIDGGRQEIIFPDLSFRRESDGMILHLELFHRWHRGQLERRLLLLTEHPEIPLVLGIDRALADDDEFAALLAKYPTLAGRIYRFRDFPGVERTVRVLESMARDREGGAHLIV